MISIIVAFDQNQLIGDANRLPWHYKEDLKYFKQTTTGHDILMGRHTFESILSYQNKPLPNRHHIVLTNHKDYNYDNVTITKELETFIKEYPINKELFIIGGRSIYEQTLPYVDRLYVTHINESHKGDTYFPEVDWKQWKCVSERVEGVLKFSIYERVEADC